VGEILAHMSLILDVTNVLVVMFSDEGLSILDTKTLPFEHH